MPQNQRRRQIGGVQQYKSLFATRVNKKNSTFEKQNLNYQKPKKRNPSEQERIKNQKPRQNKSQKKQKTFTTTPL